MGGVTEVEEAWKKKKNNRQKPIIDVHVKIKLDDRRENVSMSVLSPCHSHFDPRTSDI